MATGLLIASLVLAAASAYQSNQQAQRAAGARKQANAVSAAQAQVRQQQDIRDQVRAQRIKRAQIMQAATDTGVQLSSGEAGSVSSLDSQTGTNISDISGQAYTNRAISRLNQQAADASAKQQTYAQISQLSMQGFSFVSSTPAGTRATNSIFS